MASPQRGHGSYPGGKSGAGVFQRLICLIPPHRVLVVPFAGHCGIVRNIRPAEHTIVIDADEAVCEWWDSWRRSKAGRDLEIHHCDGIEWLRFSFGLTEYSAAKPNGGRPKACANQNGGGRSIADQIGGDAGFSPGSADQNGDARGDGHFVFCDPPYVLSERATGRIYKHEMTDGDHERLLGVLAAIDGSRYRVMLCGYSSELYSAVDSWFKIDHQVPTRGGLQNERIWMNYPRPVQLHDFRHLGSNRRERERIRRRQKNWARQLETLSPLERQAMFEILKAAK